ncbi:uncharacterized protein LOC141860139 [Acropora palmata]|uniref:uncharacterized protein LOC141860139 n=1 Tax=Acropora palmata TaxID=6131 RepID=UPI003DA0F771
MFRFLRKNKQQQRQQDRDPSPADRFQRNSSESGPEEDFEKEDELEEELKLLFESMSPESSDDYVVPVTEIERLWLRFQQLGVNDEGMLPLPAMLQHPSFKSDPFARVIWDTFPRDENGNIEFHSFAGVLRWWALVPLEEKLESIFMLLTRSEPLDVHGLKRIIMKLDNSVNDETAQSKAELLIQTMDDKDQGFIDADQWLKWISQLPENEVAKLTNFAILPEISEIDAQLPKSSRSDLENGPVVSDELLVEIAGKIGERDWASLAHELGFTKQEIRDIKVNYPHSSQEQVYQVLMQWKQKAGDKARQGKLEHSLRKTGLEVQSGLSR